MDDDTIDLYFWLREQGERPCDAWAHACGLVHEAEDWEAAQD